MRVGQAKAIMTHRGLQLTSIAFLIVLGASCGRSAATSSEVYPNKPSNVAGSQSQLEKAKLQDPNLLCNRIPEIKIFPMKGERGEDVTYDAFMDANKTVVPCLIEKVTDTTKIPDPRQEPGFPDIEITIGDIAFFLLVDITKIQFTDVLPPDVRKEYKEDGVYAYFKFVKNPANREKLKDRLQAWYREKRQQTSPPKLMARSRIRVVSFTTRRMGGRS
jgi:hypothetical protein